MEEIDNNLNFSRPQEIKDWTPEDGGESYVREAIEVAKKTLRHFNVRAEIKVTVSKNGDPKGEATFGSLILHNINRPGKSVKYIGGVSVPEHLQIAAHEAAHLGWGPKGEKVMKHLKLRGKSGEKFLTTYHSLAGHFEGAMEAVAFFILSPRKMRSVVPDVYNLVADWLNVRNNEVNMSKKIQELTEYAVSTYRLFAPDRGNRRELAKDVAYAVGPQAARMGWDEESLVDWLQTAYVRVWVGEGRLNPGADLKEIRKFLITAFRRAKKRMRA